MRKRNRFLQQIILLSFEPEYDLVLVFDVVDILKFDGGNKASELKIIYDTISTGVLIEELKK